MPGTTHFHKIALEATLNRVPVSFANSYLGLCSNDPTSAGLLSSEVAVADYTRQVYTPSSFTTYISNTNEITWAPAANWGAVSYVFLIDSSQGGNMLFYDLVTEFTANSGAIIRIPVGNYAIE